MSSSQSQDPPSPADGLTRIPTIELLLEIRRLADDLGHTPTAAEMNEHGAYSTKPYKRDDPGGWNEAIWAAGLEPYERDRIPTKDLRDALLKLAATLDKTPTAAEMDEHGPYSARTYVEREEFGSWNGALDYAGLEPNRNTQSAKKRPSATGSGTRYTVVRRNATMIANLPDPLGDDPWFRSGDHDISQSLLQKLWTSGLVCRKKDSSGFTVRRWRLKPHIYETAVEYAKSAATLPCGHTGVRNVSGGGYECSRCGDPCTRAEAEATLSGRTLDGGVDQ